MVSKITISIPPGLQTPEWDNSDSYIISSVNLQTAQGNLAAFLWQALPSLLPCEALVQQRQNLRYVELDILQIERLHVILLHFKKIIELEIQFE